MIYKGIDIDIVNRIASYKGIEFPFASIVEDDRNSCLDYVTVYNALKDSNFLKIPYTIVNTADDEQYRLFSDIPIPTAEYCEKCDEKIAHSIAIEAHNEIYCVDCFINHEFVHCANCHEYIPADEFDKSKIVDDDRICGYCLEDTYSYCATCNSYHHNDDMHLIDNESICTECRNRNYTECDSCGNYYNSDNEGISDSNHTYCGNCASDYTVCETCGDIVHNDYAQYNENSGYSYCRECYRDQFQHIHAYNYEPSLVFHGSGPLFFGFELEMETGSDESDREKMAEFILGELPENTVYLKDDGSLSNGIEMVSHPADFPSLMNRKDEYTKLFRDITERGGRSHDPGSCGLHFHVSRNFFASQEDILKCIYLFEWNYFSILRFSRRTSEQADEWAKRYTDKDFPSRSDVSQAIQYNKNTKYMAVRLNKGPTIEFRIMRGTLNAETFFATLQFLYNLVRMSKEKEFDELKKCKYKDIVNFEQFDELNAYSVKRNLI